MTKEGNSGELLKGFEKQVKTKLSICLGATNKINYSVQVLVQQNHFFDRGYLMDKTDRRILNILQRNGRITNSKLAGEIGISPPAMLERVKRLENSGMIRQYAALIDREKAGFSLLAMIIISVSLNEIKSLEDVKDKLIILDEVQECYQLTGDVDFLLKVAVRDMNSYTTFINAKLTGIPGIQNIRTSFVLETVKSSTVLQLDEE